MPKEFSIRDLVRNALLLRLGLAITLHLFVSEEVFAPDQLTYHENGAWLAWYWAGETLMPPARLLQPGPTAYFYVVAVLYSVFGPYSLVPKLVNALLGALTVPVVYDIARRTTGNLAVAARAATYTAYFPSLILWSALNIRDAWVVLLILLICREALVLQDRFNLRALLFASAAVIAVAQFRSYIFFAVVVPMLASFLIRNRRHIVRNVVLGLLLSMVVVYVTQAAGAGPGIGTFDLEEIQARRQGMTMGAKSGFETVDISTPGRALVFLPIGLAYFLLAPFPWSVSGVRQALTLPEMLFFYSLIPAIIRGIRDLLRTRLSDVVMIMLIVAGLTFGYAIGEGNAGTAYRHRAQVICFYLIFAAAGVEARRQNPRLQRVRQ